VMERLFQPFVSTKPEGMGMGLNICRSIIELHQGRLDVAERAGGGTVFTVALPLAAPTPAGVAA
ncbi:histidine kinase, partial [Mycobacterium tuberculosis]|nr:histidine kinase [Mycobacterium tuberculosis]